MIRNLVLDLGAGSGRAMISTFDGERLEMEEIYRFSGIERRCADGPYWDYTRLLSEVDIALEKAAAVGPIDSIGVDSWGVDYVLFGEDGKPLQDPHHYRHPRSLRGQDAFPIAPKDLFRRTGSQILPVNTVYQLFDHCRADPALLEAARFLLMIADAVTYHLTRHAHAETTLARSSGMLALSGGEWDSEVCARAGLPIALLPAIVTPGTVCGELRREHASKLGLSHVPVVAVAGHDTASAVCGLPLEAADAFLICGSWSIIGVEVPAPILMDAARADGFGNEGGVEQRQTFLKSLNGLHLLQKLKLAWEQKTAETIDFAQLSDLARSADGRWAEIRLDLGAPAFFDPIDMIAALEGYLIDHRLDVAKDIGSLARLLYGGLVHEIALAFAQLQSHLGRRLDAVRVCGGGGQDGFLCQLVANAIDRPVIVGPIEASAWGNAALQLIGLKQVADVSQARKLVAKSVHFLNYYPQTS